LTAYAGKERIRVGLEESFFAQQNIVASFLRVLLRILQATATAATIYELTNHDSNIRRLRKLPPLVIRQMQAPKLTRLPS